MRTSRVTVVAFVLGWMLSAAVGAAVGSVISGQDKDTRPTCSALAGTRGRIWYEESASGTADYAQQCQKDAANAYAWQSVAIGGTLSSATSVSLSPTSTYGVSIGTAGTKVACAVGIRGSLFYEAGGAGVADTFYVCTKAAADTYAWRDIALVTP